MKKRFLNVVSSAAIATSLTTLASLSAPLNVNAATFSYNFDNIFPITKASESSGDLLNGFLKMDVTDSQGGVTFVFKNLGSNIDATSYIGGIFIDTPSNYTAILGLSAPTKVASLSSGTTSFTGQAGGNLPQGGKISFTDNYEFQRNNGAANGIQKNEAFAANFSGGNFSAVVTALNNGSLKVGYHLQAIGSAGQSDAFVNNPGVPTPPPRAVPVPGFVLGIMAAGALGGTRLLKTKKQAV